MGYPAKVWEARYADIDVESNASSPSVVPHIGEVDAAVSVDANSSDDGTDDDASTLLRDSRNNKFFATAPGAAARADHVGRHSFPASYSPAPSAASVPPSEVRSNASSNVSKITTTSERIRKSRKLQLLFLLGATLLVAIALGVALSGDADGGGEDEASDVTGIDQQQQQLEDLDLVDAGVNDGADARADNNDASVVTDVIDELDAADKLPGEQGAEEEEEEDVEDVVVPPPVLEGPQSSASGSSGASSGDEDLAIASDVSASPTTSPYTLTDVVPDEEPDAAGADDANADDGEDDFWSSFLDVDDEEDDDGADGGDDDDWGFGLALGDDFFGLGGGGSGSNGSNGGDGGFLDDMLAFASDVVCTISFGLLAC